MKINRNCIIGSEVIAIILDGCFCLLVELNWEGSVSAACAAGLFTDKTTTTTKMLHDFFASEVYFFINILIQTDLDLSPTQHIVI